MAGTGRDGGSVPEAAAAGEELDVIEQLRRESVDIRINPVAMRRVIFKLQTSFKRASLLR